MRAISDASPDAQKMIIDAVDRIKPVTINGKVAGKSWLTGEECTLVDLYVAANLAAAY